MYGYSLARAQDMDTELTKLTENLATKMAAHGCKKVTVLDFTDLQGGSSELGKYIAEQLSVDFVMTNRDFSVLDRANLKSILAEHKLTATGLVDPENAKQLGKFAGVDALIIGNIIPKNQNINLTVKIITTETAEIVGGAKAEFKIDDIVRQFMSRPAKGDSTMGDSQPQSTSQSTSTDEVAVIKTTEGEMVIRFWPDVAPNTVANFKKLARDGLYNGTCFHRVINGFMIQGGDPLTKNPNLEAKWGTGGSGTLIKAEFNDRPHVRGVISMARADDPDSASSQFFICDGDAPALNHKYTAFGELIKGDDVLQKIAATPTHPPARPDRRIGVESIRIVSADSVR